MAESPPGLGEQPRVGSEPNDEERRPRRRRRGRRGGRRGRDRDGERGTHGEGLAAHGHDHDGDMPEAEANGASFAHEAVQERVETVIEDDLQGPDEAEHQQSAVMAQPAEPVAVPSTAAGEPDYGRPAHVEQHVQAPPADAPATTDEDHDGPSRPTRRGWWQRRFSDE
jgi:ribonuclease E